LTAVVYQHRKVLNSGELINKSSQTCHESPTTPQSIDSLKNELFTLTTYNKRWAAVEPGINLQQTPIPLSVQAQETGTACEKKTSNYALRLEAR
jgi:hypothetical protein